MRIRLTLVRVQRLLLTLILIPSVLDALFNAIAEIAILIAGDRLELGQVALGHKAAG